MSDDPPISGAVPAGQSRGFEVLHDARQLLGRKAYGEAHAACLKALDQDQGCADAYYVLGIIAYEHHDFARALDLFEQAIAARHPQPGPHVQAARCFAAMNMPRQALAQIDAAIALDPQDGFTLASIGATLSRFDRHAQAAVFHRKATQAAPNDPLNFSNLGACLQFLGDFEGARAAYRASLELAPDNSQARLHLTLITRQSPEHNDLAALQAAWQRRHPRDVEGGLRLAHAIAKVHEGLGDPASVMAWLNQGKALIRQHIPDRQALDTASIEAAKALAHTLKPATDVVEDGPVFIVGLPRTGTTLVDRIVSSHSLMVSAGERLEFAACLHRGVGTASADILDAAILSACAAIDLSAVGRSYLDRLGAILESPQRFTDKMPMNAFFVPAILAAIPSARVICLRRHPADCVLSIYRQFFAAGAIHHRFAHDLTSLATYVAEFHDLVDTYTQMLPAARFRVVDYEDLVDQTELVVRSVLGFAGLDFETACLDFHTSQAPVATASLAQVRQPIYASSKGRWEAYQAYLQPALDILRVRGKLA